VSQSASQAAAFYREVGGTCVMWTVEDDEGVPAPKTRSGRRALPLWSSRSRVQRIIKKVPAYGGFRPKSIEWSSFLEAWLPDLIKDQFLVGVNWSGPHAIGYDLEPNDLVANVTFYLDQRGPAV